MQTETTWTDPRPEIDLDRYLRASGRVDLSSVEWPRIRDRMARLGIDPAEVLDPA